MPHVRSAAVKLMEEQLDSSEMDMDEPGGAAAAAADANNGAGSKDCPLPPPPPKTAKACAAAKKPRSVSSDFGEELDLEQLGAKQHSCSIHLSIQGVWNATRIFFLSMLI
jgi:hypothetical protein